MKKNIVFQQVRRAFGNSLLLDSQIFHQKNKNGYYIGTHLTIKVYSMPTRGTIMEHTSLSAQYNGKYYQRNYDRMFCDQGLKHICARFQKEIINRKIK